VVHDRPNALLWRDDALADIERWLRQASRAAPLGEPEASFVAASRQAGRRTRWLRRLLVAAPGGDRARDGCRVLGAAGA